MPRYPSELAADGREGEVVVQFVVDRGGKPTAISVARASHPAFERAVHRALAHWRFEPGRDAHGAAVGARVTQVFRFRME